MMSPAIWASTRARIEGRCTVRAPWQPAHGPEAALPPGTGMSGWADWLLRKLDEADIDRAVFAGHSMGGMLVMEMERVHPDRVEGLLLVGTRARPWDAAEQAGPLGLAAALEAGPQREAIAGFGRMLIGEAFLAANPGWLEGWLDAVFGGDLAGMGGLMRILSARADPTPALRTSGKPIAVVHGEADAAILPADAAEMAGTLGSVPLDYAPGAGHCPPLETPDFFADVAEGFLQMNGFMSR